MKSGDTIFKKARHIYCHLYVVIVFIFLFVFTSCSQHLLQYRYPPPSNPDRMFDKNPWVATQPSHPTGGLSMYKEPEKSEEELEEERRIIRKNSLAPINYQTGSAGHINIQMTREEVSKILSRPSIDKNGLFIYEEGLKIKWRNNQTIDYIVVYGDYQGTMDFGPYAWFKDEKQKYRGIGHSFQDLFIPRIESVTQERIIEKMEEFLTAIYRYLENSNEDCEKIQKCNVIFDEKEHIVLFLPKMTFTFSKTNDFFLEEIIIFNHEDNCFQSSFDILNTRFFCGYDSNNPTKELTVSLGDRYEDVTKKLEIIPKQDPVPHNNIFLRQYIYHISSYYHHYSLTQNQQHANSFNNYNVVIDWRKNNFEEESLGPSDRLSFVETNVSVMPFLLGHAFIKVRIDDANEVHIEPMPFLPSLEESLQDETVTSFEPDSSPKVKQQSVSSASNYHVTVHKRIREHYDRLKREIDQKTEFLLSPSFRNVGPYIAGKYQLQKNLIDKLLDFLEEKYRERYSDIQIREVYKRIDQEDDDRRRRKSIGVLIFDFEDADQPTFVFQITIEEYTGFIQISSFLEDNRFKKYILQNQESIDLSKRVKTLSGFKLGEKIYLKNQNTGSGTARVAYFKDIFVSRLRHTESDKEYFGHSKEKQIFTTLAAEYRDQIKMPVAYNNEHISFQESEAIVTGDITFYINPLKNQKEEINGEIFDEYEINGISVNHNSFFGTVNNLCSIKGFNVEMGIPEDQFNERVNEEIVKANASHPLIPRDTQNVPSLDQEENQKDFEGCPYIVPQDDMLIETNKLYIFPNDQVGLAFSDQGLFTIHIYKRPSEN